MQFQKNIKNQIKSKLKKSKVLVIGDVMLDKYWFGITERISPEAPVPITQIISEDYRAGGAANVAQNIVSLGGKSILLSVIGKDEAGNKLNKIINDSHIENYLLQDDSIGTTTKLRIISRNQQLIRVDFESNPNNTALEKLNKQFEQLINESDIIILSDYNKGCLSNVNNMIIQAKATGKKILIDPKGNNYNKYKKANLITPNKNELANIIGAWKNEYELEEKTQNLRKKLMLDAILLTRSDEGLSLYSEKEVIHQKTKAKEVFDVSGAGDTIIAGFALSIASGFNYNISMKIANTAAGIVVGKLGTAICSAEELLQHLEL